MSYPNGITYAALRSHLKSAQTTFPNSAEAIAELRPHSQTIHLHKIARAELRRLLDASQPASLATPLAVIAHELTHWLDLLSTVWGQEYLVELFDAYEAALNSRANPENGWWKVMRQFDQDRRIMFPRYYKFVLPERTPHGPRNPWSIDYSCGQEFGPDGRIDANHPIFFTTFGENTTRRRIARQPISVGTLLETNATWSELITGTAVLSQIPDGDDRHTHLAIWPKERASFLYDAHLTEYTAAVHLLSARTHTQDAMVRQFHELP